MTHDLNLYYRSAFLRCLFDSLSIQKLKYV